MRPKFNNRGLTLIEILMVVFIFSTLSAVMFTVLKSGLDSWRKSEAILTMYEESRAVLDLMSREIQSAFLYQLSNDQDQWTRFLGIDQAGTRLKTDSAKDELFFVSPVAFRTGETVRQDLCEIGYWLDGKETEDTSDDVLMRYFRSFNALPVAYNFTPPFTGTDNTLAKNVKDLQFTYYYRNAKGAAPTATTTSWDSSANSLTNYDANGNLKNPDGLPDAVGISVTVRSRDGNEKTFTTMVLISGAK